MSAKLRIGVVGLGFGEVFVPIYRDHPEVGEVSICDLDSDKLNRVGDELRVERRFDSLEALLEDDRVDAVHLLSTVPFHAKQALQVLRAGKHCACAVPMATSLEDLAEIVAVSKAANKNYMLMETAVYSREFFFVKEMIDSGELGAITFLKGDYHQDLEGAYPAYWRSVPPMHYATHSLSPLIAIVGDYVRKVSCFGSGILKDSTQQPGGNRFPIQTAIFKFANSDAAIQLNRSWFQIARAYQEAFSVYGDRKGFEWQQIEAEEPIVFELDPLDPSVRWRNASATRVKVPSRPDLFPESLRPYTDGWHGGSHPHLVHEFVSSIVEGRPAYPDAARAAHWTAAGICANLSSLRDGDPVEIPIYD